MQVDFRMPNIVGNDREQLQQIRSYLYQFIPQLQWALNSIDTEPSENIPTTEKSAVQSHTSVDAEVAFNALKPLIIKSADIVEAYYEEINSKLASSYVAKSDFGTFVETNEQSINQTAQDIEQLFSNTQTILTDIENLNFTLAEVNAHIRSGKLYEDENGLPVYGLEIGQRNTVDGEEIFDKFARFTADRLSFYDNNGKEVAYISDYRLYIRNVEITSSYKIGGFLDTVMASGDVVTKWVGGDA